MFESQREVVESLLTNDNAFKRLYEKYEDLKVDVDQANIGKKTIDDLTLNEMKKKKLFLKDQMAKIIEQHHH